jgi:hypothetical protein
MTSDDARDQSRLVEVATREERDRRDTADQGHGAEGEHRTLHRRDTVVQPAHRSLRTLAPQWALLSAAALSRSGDRPAAARRCLSRSSSWPSTTGGSGGGGYLAAGNDVRDFVGIGRTYLDRGNLIQAVRHPGAPQIDVRGYRPLSSTGYDDQFSYYIAVKPRYARAYMDDPSYRYSRVLHAALAGLLGLGDEVAIPYTLLVNWLAAGFGTFFLRHLDRSPRNLAVAALLYGLFPGILVACNATSPSRSPTRLWLWGSCCWTTDGVRGRWLPAWPSASPASLARRRCSFHWVSPCGSPSTPRARRDHRLRSSAGARRSCSSRSPSAHIWRFRYTCASG